MAVVPLYMWCEGEELCAESPLVPGVPFRGATYAELERNIRGVWPSLAAQAVDNPAPLQEKYAAEYEALGRGGWWSSVSVAPAAGAEGGRERVNISIQTQLVKQADRAARDAGLSRSAYFAQAIREKLQRGV